MPPKVLTYSEKLDNAFNRVMRVAVPTEGMIIKCKLLKKANGIVKNKHANTFKVSFGKEKRLAHRVVFEKTNGSIDPTLDVSHRCHNENCVEPKHLIQEDHADNMERIGCPGWLQVGNELVLACNHTPCCLKISKPNKHVVVKLTDELTEANLDGIDRE